MCHGLHPQSFSCGGSNDIPQVIEAEVRYAVRHEYAQTAVDVIARRCRLSFLNVQAALGALPRVIEIMAEDLGWNHSRQQAEIDRATKFLASMGLPPGTEPPSAKTRSFVERFRALLGFAPHGSSEARILRAGQEMVYSRAQFEAGEIAALLGAFTSRVQQYPAVEGETHLGRADVIGLIKSLNGYAGVSQKDYEYVLTETGFADKLDFNFDEFVEVWWTFPLIRLAGFADSLQICGELRDIVFSPVPRALMAERSRIPVEKSGGGV